MGIGMGAVPPNLLSQLPPGVTGVDAIASNGGYLVLGKDGGVFALGGAQLAGDPGLGGAFSYTGLSAAQRQGTRSFTGINVGLNGGYTLVSDKGESYNFTPSKPPDPTTLPGVTPPNPNNAITQQSNIDAGAYLNSILQPLGLNIPADQAMQWYTDSGGDANYILDQLHKTTQYQTAFPEMAARQKAGLPPITEADILNYRGTVKNILSSAGMDPNILSQSDISNFISNDVSPAEISTRVQKGFVAAMQAPPEYRQALAQLGVSTGDLTHFFLDPTKAYDKITSQAAIGASALEQGYGSLTPDEMARLQGAGLTSNQADTAFGKLFSARQLTNALPGEQGGGLTREQQIGYAQGLAPDQELLQRAAAARTAEFKGGGNVQASNTGVTGLGVAQ